MVRTDKGRYKIDSSVRLAPYRFCCHSHLNQQVMRRRLEKRIYQFLYC